MKSTKSGNAKNDRAQVTWLTRLRQRRWARGLSLLLLAVMVSVPVAQESHGALPLEMVKPPTDTSELPPGALGPKTPSATNAKITYNENTRDMTMEFDELPMGMALPFFQTLRDDVAIRITRPGFTFLAQQMMRMLYGWVMRKDVSTDAEETILAVMNDSLMGFKAGFLIEDVTVIGTAAACIYLGNSDDDDGRQDNFAGGNCRCNERLKGVGLSATVYDDDCTECYVTAPPANAKDDKAGGNCESGCTTWPGDYRQPPRGPQTSPPAGGWNDNRTGVRKACMTAGTDTNTELGQPGDGGAGATHGNNIAWFDDPGNPDNPDEKYWCKGPYYDSFLVWDNSRIDPDCLKTVPTDPEEDCPLVGHNDNGTAGNPRCDNLCQFYVTPDDPNPANEDDKNDINIVFVNTGEVVEQLDIAWFARGAKVDARMGFGFELLGSRCLYISPSQPPGGSLFTPKTMEARIVVKFENGYVGMYGQDGAGQGTGGGGGASTAKGACDEQLDLGGGSGGPVGNPNAGTIGWPLQSELEDDTLLGVNLKFDEVTLSPKITGAELPNFSYVHCDGPCIAWICGCAIPCDLGGLVGSILNDMVAGGAFDATIDALLGDALAGILEDEIVGVLEDTLGLPIDFTATLAGMNGVTKTDLCALRMSDPNDHTRLMGCSHTQNNPNNCDLDGTYGAGSEPCPGYGTCPCDDYDFDGELNYQDPTPFSTPRSSGGFPTSTWSPVPGPFFTGDCNPEGLSDLWCGAWNEPGGGDYYYSWQYGVGNFFPDEGGVYYEAGGFANVVWDDGGMTIELSAGMAPWRDDRTPTENPYQGVVIDNSTPANHGAVESIASPGSDMLWNEYLTNAAVNDPTSKSCYYDPNWLGSGPVQDNLWLDSTQRDRNRADLEDASNITARWMVGRNVNPEVLIKRFEFNNPGALPTELSDGTPTAQVNDVYWGASNDLVIAGTNNGLAHLYRLGTNGWEFEQTLNHTDGIVRAVALSPSGGYAAIGGNSGMIEIYKYDSGGDTWNLHAEFWDDGVQHEFFNDCVNCPEYSLCAFNQWDSCPCDTCTAASVESICGADQCNPGPGPSALGAGQVDVYNECGCYHNGTDGYGCPVADGGDWTVCGCAECATDPSSESCRDESGGYACGSGQQNTWKNTGGHSPCQSGAPETWDDYQCQRWDCDAVGCANVRDCRCADGWTTTNEPRQRDSLHNDITTRYGSQVCLYCAGDRSGDADALGCGDVAQCRYCNSGINSGGSTVVRWADDNGDLEDDGICEPQQCFYGPETPNLCRACDASLGGSLPDGSFVYNVDQDPNETMLSNAPQCIRADLCSFGCDTIATCQVEPGANGLCPDGSTPPTCGDCTFGNGGAKRYDGHASNILDIDWHPNNDAYIVSSSSGSDERVILWDPTLQTVGVSPSPRTRQIYEELVNANEITYSDGGLSRVATLVAFNLDGTRIALGLENGTANGFADIFYGVDDDATPFNFTASDGSPQESLDRQGNAGGLYNCGSEASRDFFGLRWLDEEYLIASGRCNGSNSIKIRHIDTATHGGSSIGSGWTRNLGGTLAGKADFTSDGRAVYVRRPSGSDQVVVWDYQNTYDGLGNHTETYSGEIIAMDARGGGGIEPLYDDWDTFKVPGGVNSVVVMTSQQFVQELFYTLYNSGALCIDFSPGQSDLIDSLLAVESMRTLVPFLGDVCDQPSGCQPMGVGDVSEGQFIWSQKHGVRVKFRPKDLPIAKVLGGRTDDCFPDGDLIPSSGRINDKDGTGSARIDDSLTDIHTESPDCADISLLSDQERRVYDLLLYMPHYQVEFWAPLSDETNPSYDAEDYMQLLFTEDLNVALVMAIEHAKPWSVQVPTEFSGSANRFFEILMDAAIGCGGNLFDGTYASFDTDWYQNLSSNCGIQLAAAATDTVASEAGVSDLMHTLLNSTLSLLIQGELTIAGLNADFYKIGAGFPTENNGSADKFLDSDDPLKFGGRTPDYLVGAAQFVGAIDFNAIFGLLGSIGTAPGSIPEKIDTSIGLPDRSADGFAPANVFEPKIQLTPQESFMAGFGEEGMQLDLSAAHFEDEYSADEIAYTWRIAPHGNWHPYSYATIQQLPNLPTGRYTIEVKAKRPDNIMDATPASISFYVDKTAPHIRLIGDNGDYVAPGGVLRPKHGEVDVLISENISDLENVDVVYSVDGGNEWLAVRAGDRIDVDDLIDDGARRLKVRATDEFRNVEEHLYILENGGGCGAGGTPTGNWWIYALMALGWLIWRRTDRKALRGAAAAIAVALFGVVGVQTPAWAISFEYEIGEPLENATDGEPTPLAVPNGSGPVPGLAGAAPITGADDAFYLYLNSYDNDNDTTGVPECVEGTSHDECISAGRWAQRTVDALLNYIPMQEALQDLVHDLLDPGPQDVCFYTGANYTGTEYCYNPAYVHNTVDVPAAPAGLSSAKIPEGMVAHIWDFGSYNDQPTGFYMRLVKDEPNFTTLTPNAKYADQTVNDDVSSFKIQYLGRPFLDEQLSIPLIGAFNLGFFVRDMWGSPSEGYNVGPRALTNPALYIAGNFQDSNTVSVNLLDEILTQGDYIVDIETRGAADADEGGIDLGERIFDGGLRLSVEFTDHLDLDVLFAQPANPSTANVEAGVYFHGGGKMRVKNLKIDADIYTNAGNLRELKNGRMNGRATGYDLGLGLQYAKISGEIILDLNSIKCWNKNDVTLRFCDADKLDPSHPQYGDHNAYADATSVQSKLLGDAISYMETAVVYEAQRVTGQLEDILTAVALLDFRDITHTQLANGTYSPPEFEHPLDGNEMLLLDYAGFWRFNAEDSAWNDGSLVMPGGFAIDLALKDGPPGWCTNGNPVPSMAGAEYVAKPFTDVTRSNRVKNGREAMLGFGLHMDPVNRFMDRLFENYAGCMAIDKNSPVLGEVASSILNTDTFQSFMPGMDDSLLGRDMSMQIRPRYVPVTAAGEYETFYDPMKHQPNVTVCNEDRPCYPSKGTTNEDGSLNALGEGPYDLHIEIPMMDVAFNALGTESDPQSIPLFRVEAGFDVWLGVGLYKLSAQRIIDFGLQGQPCDVTPSPCRVLRLNVAIETSLHNIFELQLQPGPTTTSSFNPQQLEAGISQVLVSLFNGAVGGTLEVVTNVGDEGALGLTFNPVTDGSPPSGNAFDFGVGVESIDLVDNDGSDEPQYLALYLNPSDNIGNYNQYGTAPVGPDGYADVLPPDMIFQILQNAGIFAPPEIPNFAPKAHQRIEKTAHSGIERGPQVFLSLPQTEQYGSQLELSAADVKAAGLLKTDSRIHLDALLQPQSEGRVRYQYQFDGGLFQVTNLPYISMPHLFEGKHTLKVWGISKDGFISPVAAEMDFVVDRLGPKIQFVGDTSYLGDNGYVELGLQVEDAVSPAAELDVAWRIDDGAWQAVDPYGSISDRVRGGQHTLEVRAVDAVGNQRVRQVQFAADAGGGCSTSGGNAANMWVLLLVVGYVWVSRRKDARFN